MIDCTVFFPPRAKVSTSWLLLGRDSLIPAAHDALNEAGDLLGIRLDASSHALRACLEDSVTGHVVEMAACVGLYRSLPSFGLRPTLVTGHSMGLYSALVATGCLSLRQGLEFFASDLERVAKIPGGFGTAIRIPVKSLEEACETLGDVWISGRNAEWLNGVSGTPAGLAKIELWAQEQGGRFARFSGYGPWHCRLTRQAEAASRRAAVKAIERDPQVPIMVPLPEPRTITDREGAVRSIVDQMIAPVAWQSVCGLLLRRVGSLAVEVGPEPALSKMLQGAPRDRRRLVHWRDLGRRALGVA